VGGTSSLWVFLILRGAFNFIIFKNLVHKIRGGGGVGFLKIFKGRALSKKRLEITGLDLQLL